MSWSWLPVGQPPQRQCEPSDERCRPNSSLPTQFTVNPTSFRRALCEARTATGCCQVIPDQLATLVDERRMAVPVTLQASVFQ